jgi:hypothetical protein
MRSDSVIHSRTISLTTGTQSSQSQSLMMFICHERCKISVPEILPTPPPRNTVVFFSPVVNYIPDLHQITEQVAKLTIEKYRVYRTDRQANYKCPNIYSKLSKVEDIYLPYTNKIIRIIAIYRHRFDRIKCSTNHSCLFELINPFNLRDSTSCRQFLEKRVQRRYLLKSGNVLNFPWSNQMPWSLMRESLFVWTSNRSSAKKPGVQ